MYPIIRRCRLYKRCIARCIVGLTLLFAGEKAAAVGQDVLIVHSYHHEHAWTAFLTEGFDSAFKEDKNIRVFHEYLDAKRYPDSEFKQIFIRYLNNKYSIANVKVIVVSDDDALQLLRENRSTFFPKIPLVYLGINKVDQGLIDTPNMTGVFENRDIGATIINIKAMTGVDEIIVITDKSAAGRANASKIEKIKNTVNAPKSIHIIDDLEDDDIVERLGGVDSKVPILLIGQLISVKHNHALLSWNKGTVILSQLLDNPIFTIAITTLEHGAVGAHELHGSHHAQRASVLIKQVLQGRSVNEIEPIRTAESEWFFHGPAMKKHGLTMKLLPENSKVLYQEKSFYDRYKAIVWLVMIAFLIALIIIFMLFEINRRGRYNRSILAENESRYRDLAHAGASIFWETDTSQNFTYISGSTEAIFNISSGIIYGKSVQQLFTQEGILAFPWSAYNQLSSEKKPIENIIFNIKLPNNQVKVVMVKGSPIFDGPSFKGYRGIIKEVTKEHNLTQKLAYQATYDSLTGLINRASFNNQLKEYAAQVDKGDLVCNKNQAAQLQSYLCFLDLDRFKLVNDTAGHLVGDAMLAEIADVINSCIDEKDILGRLGGDEFGLILVDKDHVDVCKLCEEIIDAISQYRYCWEKIDFNVGVSIGVVAIANGLNAIELLSKADLSCYKAKDAGRNRFYIADVKNQDLYAEQLEMGYIANVTQVIEKNQFYLVKQAIKPVSTTSECCHHYELLVRYKDEMGKHIPPNLFIPAAEKHGVIGMIDEWVLTTVFNRYKEYFPDGNTLVSVNLSGMTLSNDDLIVKIKQLIETSGVNAKNICFEITETAAISQLSHALEFIGAMKAIGVKFAIDDFGSGASSFAYLKNLPVDYLKIDGSLIKNITNESTDRAIVASIHSIAHMMGMKTIAEFVENDKVRAVLETMGIDYVQGYGVGIPEDC